jgi:hypothetical protein
MTKQQQAEKARAMLKRYAFTKALSFSKADTLFLVALLRKARDAK